MDLRLLLVSKESINMGRLAVSNLSLDVPGRRLLDNIDLAVEPGECTAVVGPSGSGKTSLLNCLCGITNPTDGSVWIDDTELTTLRVTKRSAFRLRRIGMVFQFGELLPELTALENVALPLRLMGTARNKAEKQAAEWLESLGLNRSELHSAHPDVLSGGEIQRVGVARALAHEPGLVLADEPTGALDEENTSLIVGLLSRAAKDLGAVVVVVTHDTGVASKADRAVQLRDGRLTPADRSELTGRVDT